MKTGQTKIGTTGTQVPLVPANGAPSVPGRVTISTPAANAAPISVGLTGVNNTHDGTGNGFLIAAGQQLCISINDATQLFINGTAADYVSWIVW